MITISYKGQTIASGVSLADNFWTRLCGYMFRSRPHLPGILFEPAPSIHTFFMFFSIDVVFMNKENKIIKIYRNMAPWRHSWFYFNSRRVLELPAGKLPKDITEGEVLEVKHV